MRVRRLRTSRVDWREVDGEVVALDRDASVYLSANHTGAALWEMLATGATSDSLVKRLVEEFDVTEETAAVDVDRFLAELESRDLLEP